MAFVRNSFWRVTYLVYPHLRDFLLQIGVMKHSGRQPFVIGRLKPNLSKKILEEHLKKCGYQHNVLAWIDEGEILSVRQRIGATHQYHIRVYRDSEVRGHYEIAPEYAPLEHLHCEVFERNKHFRRILKDFLAKKWALTS